eukprot:2635433-Rhodomonas_salina.1
MEADLRFQRDLDHERQHFHVPLPCGPVQPALPHVITGVLHVIVGVLHVAGPSELQTQVAVRILHARLEQRKDAW